MNSVGRKLVGVIVGVAVVGVAIGLYISIWATSFPKAIASTPSATTVAEGGTDLTLETVAAVGATESPQHPQWVSYLVRSGGRWVHSTIYRVPAHSLVHVTIYQFDSPTGLRNAFMSQAQGTVGSTTIDGKAMNSIPAEEASHTFAIPQLGVFVPLPGVSEEAKHPCEEGPCEPSQFDHRTIQFTFRTGAPGKYHWQCFVPCGAGYYFGNGGPMQTLGYMGGFIEVV